jgi:hypothetical protein
LEWQRHTTAVANSLGYKAYGFDLNPVMVVVAKARLLSKREHSSLEPLSAEIIQKARQSHVAPADDDPLQTWLCPTSANVIRKIERAIQLLLVDHEHYEPPATRTTLLICLDSVLFFTWHCFEPLERCCGVLWRRIPHGSLYHEVLTTELSRINKPYWKFFAPKS